VLHIATVHYGSPLWVEIQTRYLREHVSVPYQTWASLQRIDPSYASYFDRVINQTGRHSDKLNHLAIEIRAEAADDDLLMFLDGDAFPIANLMPLISDGLAQAPLMAVRRDENLGDPQPHPCFCVTTVGTWRKLSGDWSPGYTWTNAEGQQVSDVGGNLLRQLELTNTPWFPVLRSNHKNIDSVFFGIYGDAVYHHGAGFRGADELTRFHLAQAPKLPPAPRLAITRSASRRRNWRSQEAWQRDTRARLARLSDEMIARIRHGDSDWVRELV
jgi:hypothetical protein